MDMNALLRAHQIALVGKTRATSLSRRAAYRGAITALAARIRRTRKAGGADVDAARFVVGERAAQPEAGPPAPAQEP